MTETNVPKARPLSPHIQIYGWNITFLMSGFHRASGFAIYFGSIIPIIWLLSLALGKDVYEWVMWLYGTWFFGIPVMIAFSWGVIHHALGGIRHFIWDCCYGLEKEQRQLFAYATIIGSVSLTVILWVVIFALRVMA